jgi:hypothetical protein
VSPIKNQKSKIMLMSLQTEFPERLTTLCTGQAGLRGGLKVEIREPSPLTPLPSDGRGEPGREPSSPTDPSIHPSSNAPILDFIASDETLDRYDEIISVSGWKLNNYRRNPVFQNAHQYGDIIFTLGKALITEVRQLESPRSDSPDGPRSTPCLFQRVLFATDVNPMARIAYGLYKGKFLNAVSVGFIPLRWENGDGSQDGTRSASARAAGSKPYRRRYLEQELLEVSAVGIPANPEALQLGLKAGAIERADLRDTLDLLRQLVGTPTVCSSPTGPTGPTDRALLALARELRDILKH